jgi:DNA-binding CsgD family transcriptional regulator
MAPKNSFHYHTPDLAVIVQNYRPNTIKTDTAEHISRYRKLFEKLIETENTFSFFFMMDFTTMQYAFVSSSVKNINGYTAEEYMAGGMDFAFRMVHDEDKPVLQKLHNRLFQYYYSTPVPERKNLKFSFNLRIRKPDQSYMHIMQQAIFLEISETGEPLLDFSTVTDITPFKKNNSLTLAIYKLNAEKEYVPVFQQDFHHEHSRLSRRQQEILKLISEGLTTKEIAHHLHLSIDTVKNHRKKILQVTGGKNIAEAIRLESAFK